MIHHYNVVFSKIYLPLILIQATLKKSLIKCVCNKRSYAKNQGKIKLQNARSRQQEKEVLKPKTQQTQQPETSETQQEQDESSSEELNDEDDARAKKAEIDLNGFKERQDVVIGSRNEKATVTELVKRIPFYSDFKQVNNLYNK